MDSRRFDHLARALTELGTRRSLLGLLATLPVLGGLVTILSPDDLAAKDRRRRRKQRHKRHKQPGDRKKGCKPQGKGKVCAGRCGPMKSKQTCGKTVECGSCDCSPACAVCFTCQGADGAPGACVPQVAGTPCGEGTICESGTLLPQGACDGAGACLPGTPSPCVPYTQCDSDACATSCSIDDDCVAGSFCNAFGQCVGDLQNGETCTHDGQCASGFCVDDVCCNTACVGVCQACNVVNQKGTCQVAPGTACSASGICLACAATAGCGCSVNKDFQEECRNANTCNCVADCALCPDTHFCGLSGGLGTCGSGHPCCNRCYA